MLTVPVAIGVSEIHGYGLFALRPIRAGTVVWRFAAPDDRIPFTEADEQSKHYGYVNPANPAWLVRCGDDALWWNFSGQPNCGEQHPPTATQEAPLIALCDIEAGEELTLSVTTDADAARKLRPQILSTLPPA